MREFTPSAFGGLTDRLCGSKRSTFTSAWIFAIIVGALVPACWSGVALAADHDVRREGAIGDGKADDRPAIQRSIDAAIADGNGAKVLIPPGNYRLGDGTTGGPGQLQIVGARGLAIVGSPGTSLISGSPQQHIFQIEKSSDITLQRLSLDRQPVLFSQAVVRSVDVTSKTATLDIEPGYAALDASLIAPLKLLLVFTDPASKTWGDHGEDCTFYKPDDPSVCWPPTITARRRLGPNSWEVTLNTAPQNDYVGKRSLVWSGVYKGRAFLIRQSRDVTIEDVDDVGGGGESFIIEHCDGQITLRRFRIGIPPGSDRLLTAGGGGMVFNNHATLVLDHVDISDVWDDALNIGANYARVYAQPASDTLQVDGTRGDFRAGDTVSVMDWDHKSEIAHIKISQMEQTDAAHPSVTLHLDRPVKVGRTGYAPTRSTGNGDDRIDRVIDLDSAGHLRVMGSRFSSLHARCLLIKSSDSVVADSTCHDTVMAGIMVGPQFFWDEGPAVHDLTIRHDRFVDVSGPNILVTNGGSPRAPHNGPITINGNDFAHFGLYRHGVAPGFGNAIAFPQGDAVTMKYNTFSPARPGLLHKTALPDDRLTIN